MLDCMSWIDDWVLNDIPCDRILGFYLSHLNPLHIKEKKIEELIETFRTIVSPGRMEKSQPLQYSNCNYQHLKLMRIHWHKSTKDGMCK